MVLGATRPASLHMWEQWQLPLAARDGRLLCLSGSAPWLGSRRTSLLMHDAAVFDCPDAYTAVFAQWYRMLFRRMARRAERLWTVSDFSRARLAARLDVPETRFGVLPNAADHLDGVDADPSVLDRFGLRDTRFFLAVASANPTKNIAALVQAFAAVAADGIGLVLVGGNNARVFAESVSGERPVDRGVVRTGPVDDRALKGLYRQAVALVVPSTYEGFGLTALEAMREGCPVVAARAAALPEVCGDAALFVDPRSPADIADALHRVLADDALRTQLRHAGIARAKSFTWADTAARLRASLMRVDAASPGAR